MESSGGLAVIYAVNPTVRDRLDPSIRERMLERWNTNIQLMDSIVSRTHRAVHMYVRKSLDSLNMANQVTLTMEYKTQDPDLPARSIDIVVLGRPGGPLEGFQCAIEVDGEPHFLINCVNPLRVEGGTILRDRDLRERGWTVIPVPYLIATGSRGGGGGGGGGGGPSQTSSKGGGKSAVRWVMWDAASEEQRRSLTHKPLAEAMGRFLEQKVLAQKLVGTSATGALTGGVSSFGRGLLTTSAGKDGGDHIDGTSNPTAGDSGTLKGGVRSEEVDLGRLPLRDTLRNSNGGRVETRSSSKEGPQQQQQQQQQHQQQRRETRAVKQTTTRANPRLRAAQLSRQVDILHRARTATRGTAGSDKTDVTSRGLGQARGKIIPPPSSSESRKENGGDGGSSDTKKDVEGP